MAARDRKTKTKTEELQITTSRPRPGTKILGYEHNSNWYVALSSVTGFKQENIVIQNMKKIIKTIKGKQGTEYISGIRYADDNGKLCIPDTVLTKQRSYFQGTFNFYATEEEKKDLNNIEGFQLVHNSCANPEDLSPDEMFLRDWNSALIDAIWKKMGQIVEAKEPGLPKKVSQQYGSSIEDGNPFEAIKPIYELPSVSKEDKTKDPSKPTRAYLKLSAYGKGRDIKCNTKIYGPGDKLVRPSVCIGKSCMAAPEIVWEAVCWGAQKSNHSANIRYKITNLIWSPIKSADPPRQAPRNEDPEESESGDETNSDHDSDENGSVKPGDFDSPFEDEPQPQPQPQRSNKSFAGSSSKSSTTKAPPVDISDNEESEPEFNQHSDDDQPKTPPPKMSKSEERRARLLSKKK